MKAEGRKRQLRESQHSEMEPVNVSELILDFTCNICGAAVTDCPIANLDREDISCFTCGSTVRLRSIAHLVSIAVFGRTMSLADFPIRKSIHGLGLSDSDTYASVLERVFSYKNTFLHKDPVFDIEKQPARDVSTYDFVISSDVFEHVKPPAINAFRHTFNLLKPGGHLILTVPYTNAEKTIEHFPNLEDLQIVHFGEETLMIERSVDGRFHLHDQLVFHGGSGATLEMRVFSRADLLRIMAEVGFEAVEFFETEFWPFGIRNKNSWGFPILARRPPLR